MKTAIENRIYPIFLLTFLFMVNVALTQTTVNPGFVHGTWTKVNSPYNVFGSIKIPNDSNLVIEPGVTVNFQGHYKLLVEGSLIAEGLLNDSITFTASNHNTGWYGIRFDNILSSNDSSKFKYCSLKWGNANGINNDSKGGAFFIKNFSKISISNCLINNTSSIGGGAIYCDNSSPQISNNVISNSSGAAIFSENMTNLVIASNIIRNTDGTAIHLAGNASSKSTAIIDNNSIINSSKTALYSTHCIGTISNNTISGNNSSNNSRPGGLWIDYSKLTIENNIIQNNISTSYAGGIFFYFSDSTKVVNNYINNNLSDGGGGAISCISSNIDVINNVITNNTSQSTVSSGLGGALMLSASNPYILNNTIANNNAEKGGAIYLTSGSSPTITNSIIYGNTATSGNQIYVNDEPSDPIVAYSNIEDGLLGFAMNGHFFSGTYQSNIDTIPYFVNPTQTSGHNVTIPFVDWSLSPNSPCVDAGSPTGSFPTKDINGQTRLVNGVIDMGAFELQTALGTNSNYTFKNNLKFYPNPVSSQISVKSPFELNQNIQLRILDASAKLVMLKKIKSDSNILIEVNNLGKGIYLIQMIGEKQIYTGSFIKE